MVGGKICGRAAGGGSALGEGRGRRASGEVLGGGSWEEGRGVGLRRHRSELWALLAPPRPVVRLLLTTHYPPPATRHPPPATRYPLPATLYLLPPLTYHPPTTTTHPPLPPLTYHHDHHRRPRLRPDGLHPQVLRHTGEDGAHEAQGAQARAHRHDRHHRTPHAPRPTQTPGSNQTPGLPQACPRRAPGLPRGRGPRRACCSHTCGHCLGPGPHSRTLTFTPTPTPTPTPAPTPTPTPAPHQGFWFQPMLTGEGYPIL